MGPVHYYEASSKAAASPDLFEEIHLYSGAGRDSKLRHVKRAPWTVQAVAPDRSFETCSNKIGGGASSLHALSPICVIIVPSACLPNE